jgi:hypothetical protein
MLNQMRKSVQGMNGESNKNIECLKKIKLKL